jgi:hypothetical protein
VIETKALTRTGVDADGLGSETQIRRKSKFAAPIASSPMSFTKKR